MGAALARREPLPKQANAAGMDFCGHKNHGLALSACQGSSGGFDFVGSVQDRRFEDVNRFRWNSFVNQDELVVIILAGESNAHLFQGLARLRGTREPDFRRVSVAVEFRRLHGAQRHCAAEHDDGSGFHELVLHDQPAADPKEDH